MAQSIQPDLDRALDHFDHDLATIRTGRATPAVVESIMIECYGGRTPLQQLAAIHAPEPRLLVIQPWDPSISKDVEKALAASSVGISPVVDGKTIRLPFPSMTEERRQELEKIVTEKAEQTRVRIRGIREDEVKRLRQEQRDGHMSEDELTLASKSVQHVIDQAIARVAATVVGKTKDIQTI